MVKKKLWLNYFREIWSTKSRFISIMLMIALGVAFFAGLKTTGPNMEDTADKYFDDYNLMDIQAVSTLGLTDDDVKALSALDEVALAEGGYTVDAMITGNESDEAIKVHSLSSEGINSTVIREGRLPETEEECVVEQKILDNHSLKIGDMLTIETSGTYEDSLKYSDYEIVGVVESPYYISRERGTGSIGSGSVSGFIVLNPDAFDLDYYTEINILANGAAELNTFSDEYEKLVDMVIANLEDLGEVRVRVRYDEIVSEANDELDKARQELTDAKEEAEEALNDARSELDSGWVDYYEGERELDENRDKYNTAIKEAESELTAAYNKLISGQAEYNSGVAELQKGQKDAAAALSELEAAESEARAALDSAESEIISAEKTLAEQEAVLSGLAKQLEALKSQIDALTAAGGAPETIAALQAEYDAYMNQYNAGASELAAARAVLSESRSKFEAQKAETEQGLRLWRDEVEAAYDKLAAAQSKLDKAAAEIKSGWASYNSGLAELKKEKHSGAQALEDGEAELVEAKQALEDGETEYAEAEEETRSEIEEAEQKLSDAEREVADIESGTWYVRDRSVTPGYSGYQMDSQRISALADVFPVIFFLVAALVCLTTMTRMVENKRVEMGSILALGYGNASVASGYILYGLLSSLSGCLIGYALGCTLIPGIIFKAYGMMYTLRDLIIPVRPMYLILSLVISVGCATLSTLWTCFHVFSETPANLLRPKAPKPGKRVLLEEIKPLWRRMSFFQKVTVRNLFRYKKRLLMTVIGIGGCTAMVITGFGLRESITDITAIQYNELNTYDLMAYLDENATDSDRESLEAYLDENNEGASGAMAYMGSASFSGAKRTIEGYYVVPRNLDSFSDFITFRDRMTGESIPLTDGGGGGGVIITEKLSELLGLSVGDEITLDMGDLRTLPIVGICENYVFHYVYMTGETYRQIYGSEPEYNVAFVSAQEDQIDSAAEKLLSTHGVASVSHIKEQVEGVNSSMESVDSAVIVIIVSAAMLAFVVLYNLNNINITERLRELSTLKVLGFYDFEVSTYVLRENVVLTALGIALGQVLGFVLHRYLIRTVEIDAVMFGRTLSAGSLIISIVLTIVFAAAVNLSMHRKLKKINMVESLKMPD